MDRAHVTRNFIDTYGHDALAALLDDFCHLRSGQVSADRLGVSRERIRQWRNIFGTTVVVYQIHPDVMVSEVEP